MLMSPGEPLSFNYKSHDESRGKMTQLMDFAKQWGWGREENAKRGYCHRRQRLTQCERPHVYKLQRVYFKENNELGGPARWSISPS